MIVSRAPRASSPESAASLLSVADIDLAKPTITAAGNQTIALAVPEVPLAQRYHLLKIASVHGAFRVASVASGEVAEAMDMGLFEMIDLLSVNEDEAATIAGAALDAQSPEKFLAAVAASLSDRQSEIQIIVTACSGVCWEESNKGHRVPHRRIFRRFRSGPFQSQCKRRSKILALGGVKS